MGIFSIIRDGHFISILKKNRFYILNCQGPVKAVPGKNLSQTICLFRDRIWINLSFFRTKNISTYVLYINIST